MNAEEFRVWDTLNTIIKIGQLFILMEAWGWDNKDILWRQQKTKFLAELREKTRPTPSLFIVSFYQLSTRELIKYKNILQYGIYRNEFPNSTNSLEFDEFSLD